MKKLVVVLVPVILIGGGVVAAGILGVINVPGLSPKKRVPPVLYGEAPEVVVKVKSTPEPAPSLSIVKRKPKPAAPEADAVITDSSQGAKKLAKVWNEIDTAKLVEIAKKWKDDELAQVLASMDPAKSSALLAQMSADRAATLSAAIQKEASIVR